MKFEEPDPSWSLKIYNRLLGGTRVCEDQLSLEHNRKRSEFGF